MKTKNTVKNGIINIDYEKNKISWIYYLPLLLIAGFVPLIVYGKYVDLTGTTQALYWTGQTQLLDFFSYWKSRWIIFLTATALIIYIFLFISKKLPFKKEYKYYIPLGIYAFFVILSTIFAIDVPTALNGFMDMYQGMWILLSYVTITFLVINFVNTERDIKLFLYAFIFLIIVEGLIGVGQYFGFDIFNTKFGNSLIIPSGVNVEGGLQFNFGKHTIYGTLFNTNFVGSFATLMLPMAVVFLITAKTIKKRIVAGISLFLCLFTLIGCNSKAGYIGVFASLLMTTILLRKYLLNKWKLCIVSCIIILGFLTSLNLISGGKILQQISRINIINDVIKLKNQDKNNTPQFKDIVISDNIVEISSNFQNLIIKVNDGKIYFLDNKGNELQMKEENGQFTLHELESLRVTIADNYPGFIVDTPWPMFGKLNFCITDGKIKMIGCGGRLVEPFQARTFKLLDNLEQIASNRGYIWGRTIPLLSEYFVIGAGADNYPFVFPQDDFVAKINIYMSATTVIDKPHNMYLQIAVNTGVISLVALLALWSIYIFFGVRLYWKIELNSLEKYMGLACLVSVISYLVSGIFNDSIVSIAPIFWIILAIGVSINSKLKKASNYKV